MSLLKFAICLVSLAICLVVLIPEKHNNIPLLSENHSSKLMYLTHDSVHFPWIFFRISIKFRILPLLRHEKIEILNCYPIALTSQKMSIFKSIWKHGLGFQWLGSNVVLVWRGSGLQWSGVRWLGFQRLGVQ